MKKHHVVAILISSALLAASAAAFYDGPEVTTGPPEVTIHVAKVFPHPYVEEGCSDVVSELVKRVEELERKTQANNTKRKKKKVSHVQKL